MAEVEKEMAQNKAMRDSVKSYLLGGKLTPVTIKLVNIEDGKEIKSFNLFQNLSRMVSEYDQTVAKGFADSKDKESEKALQIKVDTIIYECLLRHVVTPAEIDFAKYKKTRNAAGAYFNLRKARTLSERFSNESYATEGSVVGVVANKQAGSTMFEKDEDKDDKGKTIKRKHHKNIELTTDQYFHMANEQFGFAYHHIGHLDEKNPLETEKELVVAGKYMHRYTNAVKYLFDDTKGPQFGKLLPEGYKFRVISGKAGGLWEHLKKAGDNAGKIDFFKEKWGTKMETEATKLKIDQIKELMTVILGTKDVNQFAAKFEKLHQFVTDRYHEYSKMAQSGSEERKGPI